MSTTADLFTALRAELKARNLTYADLAQRINMAESSIKRMFAQADMPLSRIDEICQALKIDFAELAAAVVEAQPKQANLTLKQEEAVVADKKLLLVAFCVLSLWSYEQIMTAYRFTDAELVKALTTLDKLGVIELRPLNRYKLKLARTFRWLPDGPVMTYFRNAVAPEYFQGGFDAPGDLLMLTHGQIASGMLPSFKERLQRVAQDFAQQHSADMKLPESERHGYTMILAMREWEFSLFTELRRPEEKPKATSRVHRIEG